jgi:hypothetical protein
MPTDYYGQARKNRCLAQKFLMFKLIKDYEDYEDSMLY